MLKREGFRFSHVKAAWYWHKGEYRKKSGKLMSMDAMRDAWGSEKIDSKYQNQGNFIQ
jgi:hypothetical protein